jgi:hypothetical protein
MPPEFSSIEEWLGRGQNTYAYYQVLEDVAAALESGAGHPALDPVLPDRPITARPSRPSAAST